MLCDAALSSADTLKMISVSWTDFSVHFAPHVSLRLLLPAAPLHPDATRKADTFPRADFTISSSSENKMKSRHQTELDSLRLAANLPPNSNVDPFQMCLLYLLIYSSKHV